MTVNNAPADGARRSRPPADAGTSAKGRPALPAISTPLALIVIGAMLLLGWLIPGLTGQPSPLQIYWLVLPAAIAGIRFGVTGAAAASLVAWLSVSPFAALATSLRDQPHGDWFGEGLYLLTISVTVAALVGRLKLADEQVLALVTEQREQARHAAHDRGKLTQELQRRINEDTLTGLANRTAFVALLQEQLREDPERTAVLFVDLDDFKTVNDTLGHAVGDELIVAVGQRLVRGSRGHDLVARFGGDEFAVLLSHVGGDDALHPAQRILAELKAPFHLFGRTLAMRASGGLAVSAGTAHVAPEQRAQDLLKQADLAMYASKMQHTGGVTLFHEGMQSEMLRRLGLESDMHRGLADAQFYLDYQPILDLRAGRVRSVEALLRWHHPERGLIPPSEFIPVAEQTGMIVALTLWTFREATAQLHKWDQEPHTRGLTIALNMSGRVVVEPGIGSALAREVHAAGINPERIILEITESLLMDQHGLAVQTLCQLRALGMRLAVDDFGTGYSSLSRLNTLPIDEVKIDQSFVHSLNTEAGRTIVNASIAMAHGLGLRVVAEGVETERQHAALVAAGCDDIQGFWFSRPVTPDAVETLLGEDITPQNVVAMGGLPRQNPAELGATRSSGTASSSA